MVQSLEQKIANHKWRKDTERRIKKKYIKYDFVLTVGILVLGMCVVLLYQQLGIYAEAKVPINFEGIIKTRNITFNFTNDTRGCENCAGFAYGVGDQRTVVIIPKMNKYQTLLVCNHEVLHHLFDMEFAEQEEELVKYLDDYVKFELCNRVVEEAMRRSG